MNIDDQVALLMQGTEYGDDELAGFMADELRQRLTQAEKKVNHCEFIVGMTPHRLICIWGIQSRCGNYANSRIWVTKLHF